VQDIVIIEGLIFIVSVSQTKLEPDRQTGLRNSKRVNKPH